MKVFGAVPPLPLRWILLAGLLSNAVENNLECNHVFTLEDSRMFWLIIIYIFQVLRWEEVESVTMTTDHLVTVNIATKYLTTVSIAIKYQTTVSMTMRS